MNLGMEGTEPVDENIEDVGAETVEPTEPTDTPKELAAEGDELVGDTEPQEYTPDFKYKFFGNEGELDEKFRPFITDKEKEEAFKEMARKAASFDYMRETSKIDDFKGDAFKDLLASKAQIDEHYAPMEDSYNKIVQNLYRLDAYTKAGDYNSFFDNLQINKDDIIKWAANELAIRDASPEQRQQMEMQRQHQSEFANAQYENQMLRTQMQQQAVQTRTREFHNELTRPEVSEFAQKFDAVRGQGSFAQEVKNLGVHMYQTAGVDLSAADAVKRVMDSYGGFFQQQNAQEPAQTTQTHTMKRNPQNTVVRKTQQKATIPNMQGNGGSPIRKRPNSIADLRKLQTEM